MEALHVACWAVGLAFEDEHLAAARAADDARVNALRRLWVSSMEVGGECVALLRAGYPNGALARWRLLRETEVLALFLIQQPIEVSEAYFDHARMQTLKGRRDYQRWASSVGEEKLSNAEMRGMDEAVKAMVSARGEAWAGDYGWAHEALLAWNRDYAGDVASSRRPRGPTFADLEAGVGQKASKIFYASASRAIHFTLLTDDDELPSLPRPDDIDVPGVRVAESLATATAMFVLSWPPDDSDRDYQELTMLLSALSVTAGERFACDGRLGKG